MGIGHVANAVMSTFHDALDASNAESTEMKLGIRSSQSMPSTCIYIISRPIGLLIMGIQVATQVAAVLVIIIIVTVLVLILIPSRPWAQVRVEMEWFQISNPALMKAYNLYLSSEVIAIVASLPQTYLRI